jgi:hypothetical protein
MDGYKAWYLNGKRHRTDGPAIDAKGDGDKEWYLNGKRHRTDGPAVENGVNGDKEWYFEWRTSSYRRTKAIEWAEWRSIVVFEWKTSPCTTVRLLNGRMDIKSGI